MCQVIFYSGVIYMYAHTYVPYNLQQNQFYPGIHHNVSSEGINMTTVPQVIVEEC